MRRVRAAFIAGCLAIAWLEGDRAWSGLSEGWAGIHRAPLAAMADLQAGLAVSGLDRRPQR